MAYEDMTYEFILQRAMNRVHEKYPNLDNREGSIVFNALAAGALELAIAYTEIDNARNESWVDTASRENAITACKQIGIDVNIFNAYESVHRAEFNVEVPIGSRWSCDLYNFKVTGALGMENDHYSYRMECETAGSAPNIVTGELTAITDYPQGLEYAYLVECIIEGEDETSDEAIKAMYYNSLNSNSTDGNLLQYKQWCNEYEGIGNYKIFRLWNGANTIKISILSAFNNIASDELVAEFQEYIDPGISGMGDGKAIIGSFVTITTATGVPINISADITLKNGYTSTALVDKAIEDYFREISYAGNDAESQTLVSYFAIASKILNSEGVVSVSNVLVNGGTSDIVLGVEEIPIIGTAEWTVK